MGTTEFAQLGLPDALVEEVGALGYESPTPIQAAAIPAMLGGRDVVGLAQTGTGKTAAFALPILAGIDPSNAQTQALVLAPTRELALQVCEAFSSYARAVPGLRVLPVYGGQSYGHQLSGLKRGAHVVVGTPGRIIDHLERGSLNLSTLETLVLDEADEMLQMGFAEDVERILADTPRYKQVALFSATMPSSIRALAKRHLHDPLDIATEHATQSTATVRQRWIGVPQHKKLDVLTRVLETEDGDGAIVFVRTKSATEELAERLRRRGFNAAALNGDLVQAQRERTVNAIKSGDIDIIIATDVAARGLDVERISHVINYDIPHDSEAYVHRIGRTGRAGREGDAILFVTPRERRMLSSIEKAAGRPIEPMTAPTPDEVNAQRAVRFAEQITESLGSPQFQSFRALVESYLAETGTDPVDVAAALAVLSADDADFFLPDDPEPEKRERRERPAREDRSATDRGPRRPRDDGRAVYKIAVGKRHKATPSMIVGALANEGGLRRSDFGKITIGAAHSLVELPADLPPEVFESLSATRISGKLIDIQPDSGRPGGDRPHKPRHHEAGRPQRKPRHGKPTKKQGPGRPF